MKIKLLFCLALALTVATSCNQTTETPAANPIDNYKWLVGHWKSANDKRTIHEQWYETSDAELYGEAWIIRETENGVDSIPLEKLKIEIIGDTLYYIANIDQNYTANFKTTKLEKGQFEVRFPENDFPSTIKYVKLAEDKFTATLIGEEQGEPKERVLTFEKVD